MRVQGGGGADGSKSGEHKSCVRHACKMIQCGKGTGPQKITDNTHPPLLSPSQVAPNSATLTPLSGLSLACSALLPHLSLIHSLTRSLDFLGAEEAGSTPGGGPGSMAKQKTRLASMRSAGEAHIYLLIIHMCHHIQQVRRIGLPLGPELSSIDRP